MYYNALGLNERVRGFGVLQEPTPRVWCNAVVTGCESLCLTSVCCVSRLQSLLATEWIQTNSREQSPAHLHMCFWKKRSQLFHLTFLDDWSAQILCGWGSCDFAEDRTHARSQFTTIAAKLLVCDLYCSSWGFSFCAHSGLFRSSCVVGKCFVCKYCDVWISQRPRLR